MKANKVKIWARIGQMAFWIYNISYALLEIQLPGYVPIEVSGKVTEFVYCMITIAGMIIFSEAIVKLIGYFAELLEERK